jgi:FkbM family methyltransferase
MNYIINLIKKLILRIPIIGNIIKNSYKILTRLVWNIKICKLYKTKNGKFYLPVFAYKDMIANTIKNNRIYQSGILDVAKQYVEENTAVLDVGSNFGQLTIEFSKLKKNVLVYSFEAQEFVFKLLKKNINVNKCNAKYFYNLVGNESKTVKIKTTSLDKCDTWGSNNIFITDDDKKFNYIKAIKIDDLNIKEKISFMKIDVQGKDLEVLKGAKQTILKNKMPILFEYEESFENVYGYKFKDFKNFIDEINYKIQLKSGNDLLNTENDYLIIPKLNN